MTRHAVQSPVPECVAPSHRNRKICTCSPFGAAQCRPHDSWLLDVTHSSTSEGNKHGARPALARGPAAHGPSHKEVPYVLGTANPVFKEKNSACLVYLLPSESERFLRLAREALRRPSRACALQSANCIKDFAQSISSTLFRHLKIWNARSRFPL